MSKNKVVDEVFFPNDNIANIMSAEDGSCSLKIASAGPKIKFIHADNGDFSW